jgi:hypothetical protein
LCRICFIDVSEEHIVAIFRIIYCHSSKEPVPSTLPPFLYLVFWPVIFPRLWISSVYMLDVCVAMSLTSFSFYFSVTVTLIFFKMLFNDLENIWTKEG